MWYSRKKGDRVGKRGVKWKYWILKSRYSCVVYIEYMVYREVMGFRMYE